MQIVISTSFLLLVNLFLCPHTVCVSNHSGKPILKSQNFDQENVITQRESQKKPEHKGREQRKKK